MSTGPAISVSSRFTFHHMLATRYQLKQTQVIQIGPGLPSDGQSRVTGLSCPQDQLAEDLGYGETAPIQVHHTYVLHDRAPGRVHPAGGDDRRQVGFSEDLLNQFRRKLPHRAGQRSRPSVEARIAPSRLGERRWLRH